MTASIPRDEVQAHRGASALAPENTIAAFRKAAELGAKWVELDVALLADGTLVVIHDDTVDRTTSGKGSLGDLNKDDLAKLDAGSWFAPEFTGEAVPTLAETLVALGEVGLSANVEIKQHEHHKSLSQLIDAVHADIEARSPSTRIMISSFDPEALKAMYQRDPSYDLAMLWEEVPANWLEELQAIPAKTVHLYYKALSLGFLEQAAANGIKVRVWTCNSAEQMASFWPAGLTGVITDDPRVFLGE